METYKFSCTKSNVGGWEHINVDISFQVFNYFVLFVCIPGVKESIFDTLINLR